MSARKTTLATLADAFGRLLANNASKGGRLELPGEKKRERLRRIARVMDHLSRQPDSLQWHRRVERIHREISSILDQGTSRSRPGPTLWAEA